MLGARQSMPWTGQLEGCCLATTSTDGTMAPNAFRDVSCVLTWFGMPLRSAGADMRVFAKFRAALRCQPGRGA